MMRQCIGDQRLFQEFKKSIEKKYSTLHVETENTIIYIRGSLILESPNNREIDHYIIEIQIPSDYPKTVPIVREIDGRLPKIRDRHFNPDGTACLFLPDERYKYFSESSTIIDFIEGTVKDFFLWQTHYDLNRGIQCLAERRHGIKGAVDFYSEELKTEDRAVIAKFLDYLTSKKVKKHWPCFCGSGKELRYCHLDKLSDLRKKISRRDAKKSLERMRKLN